MIIKTTLSVYHSISNIQRVVCTCKHYTPQCSLLTCEGWVRNRCTHRTWYISVGFPGKLGNQQNWVTDRYQFQCDFRRTIPDVVLCRFMTHDVVLLVKDKNASENNDGLRVRTNAHGCFSTAVHKGNVGTIAWQICRLPGMKQNETFPFFSSNKSFRAHYHTCCHTNPTAFGKSRAARNHAQSLPTK